MSGTNGGIPGALGIGRGAKRREALRVPGTAGAIRNAALPHHRVLPLPSLSMAVHEAEGQASYSIDAADVGRARLDACPSSAVFERRRTST